MSEWKRKCPNPDSNPNCEKEIFYTRKFDRNRAEKLNTNCHSCALWSEETRKKIIESLKGRMPWNKGLTKKTNDIVKKMGEAKIGDKNPAKRPEVRKKLSESTTGKNNPMYGKCAYDIWLEKYGKGEADKRQLESNKKNRLSLLKNIENRCGQAVPNYSPKSISRLKEEAKKYGITDLQHAETSGGEFQVCGYFVDGHSEEKNIVIEYYEKAHEKTKERDERRKSEIMEELGCIFIVIWE